MRQCSRFVIVALVALLWLTGCSGEAAPEPTPTSSPTSTPTSPSPTSSAPDDGDVPAPAPLHLPDYPADLTLEDTAENAILAAGYFIDLVNYMQSTGDTERFEEVSATICDACQRFISRQKERYENGGYLVGGSLRFEGPIAERTGDGVAWVIRGRMVAEEGVEVVDQLVANKYREQSEEGYRLGVQQFEGKWIFLTFAFGASQ